MGISLGFRVVYVQEVKKYFLSHKMEKGHSCCRKAQKTLLQSRKLRKVSFVAENGERSLMLQKSAEKFTTQQKVKES